MAFNRRKFLKLGGAAAATTAGTIGAPAILKAQETFNWRMTTTWPAGLPYYQTGPGSATDFARRVEEMSQGRIRIRVYAAGELIPAFDGFDAASSGRQVQLNHGCSYYWAGQSFAAQYFTTVPFGMTFQGFNAWLYHGGGNELWEEVYEPFNLKPFAVGCSGVQPMGWFRDPVESMDDFRGLNIRMPGLAGDVYNAVGANARLLPGGEIFPALERGAIDAAEWVGPYLDRELGLHNAASYYYSSGWHEPSTTSEIIINKDAWNSLPEDLQAVISNAAAACNVISHTWLEARNGEALDDLVNNHGVQFRQMPDDVINALFEATRDILTTEADRDPLVKKVNDAFWDFKIKHDRWQQDSETIFQTSLRDMGQNMI
ncbi:TRAP-type mannitol/chloroaromatic compound transport system substrate-binding protein [Natronocella acetinitrilica]|uniref:TRAP-type mannitol/chloroaromatic compound transport system substrate-binding protein n=1 Tax=Natronocella acetinitrilica TaxID=414046 RepID=A0AAE3G5E8_9GAMM|nr:TRAP transporter substrate-binding protein [Natronocella acetinitrilica]MCP1675056.1 TRAP-type mannitol/chloroaromatic compound transport system substrate-binding protein [Natronocella acetinitrilica]